VDSEYEMCLVASGGSESVAFCGSDHPLDVAGT
jgi:hypothetical protein